MVFRDSLLRYLAACFSVYFQLSVLVAEFERLFPESLSLQRLPLILAFVREWEARVFSPPIEAHPFKLVI